MKAGDHAGHVQQHRPQAGAPPAVLLQCRQQQAQQEQQVVDAAPDVPEARVQVVGQPLPGTGGAQAEGLRRALGGEHRRPQQGAGTQREQALVARVGVEQQVVADRQLARRGQAAGLQVELQQQVAVAVGQRGAGRARQRAGLAVGLQLQALPDALQQRRPGGQPGAGGVRAGQVGGTGFHAGQVVHADAPLAAHPGAVDGQVELAFAAAVGHGRHGGQQCGCHQQGEGTQPAVGQAHGAEAALAAGAVACAVACAAAGAAA